MGGFFAEIYLGDIIMYYIYIVRCQDDTYYTGFTNNIEKRIRAHNEKKGAKYTRGRTPVKLIYYEEFESKTEALKREYEVKKLSRKQKELLVSKLRQDLS